MGRILVWERKARNRTPLAGLVSLALLAMAAVAFVGRMRQARKPKNVAIAHGQGMGLPRIMLWAWERPEDLRFLDTPRIGVAFLAGTVEIKPSGSVELEPRLQPLDVAPGTPLMAVVRIETPNDLWHERPGANDEPGSVRPKSPYSRAQRTRLAEMVASLARLQSVRAVQVDYDAAKSEQSSYRQLLVSIRRRLPRGMPLSITALASWCLGDPWLESLPAGTIDEAVPMLFRMGPDGRGISGYLESGGRFRAQICRGSLGLSTDEEFSRELLANGPAAGNGARRVYLFSDRAWTQAAVQRILTEVDQWDGAFRKSQ